MKTGISTSVPLYMAAVAMLLIAAHFVLQPSSVLAGSEAQYGYLQPQAGDATESGSKRFIDMRTGDSWVCDWKKCVREGRFPLAQIQENSR